jgi:hypothetical protein
MGCDATISRTDGQPLGAREHVVGILQAAFAGVEFGWVMSGPEKIARMRAKGMEFPEVLREFLETQPAKFEGFWQDTEGSGQFFFGSAEVVHAIDAVFYGPCPSLQAAEELLKSHGWSIFYPISLNTALLDAERE